MFSGEGKDVRDKDGLNNVLKTRDDSHINSGNLEPESYDEDNTELHRVQRIKYRNSSTTSTTFLDRTCQTRKNHIAENIKILF